MAAIVNALDTFTPSQIGENGHVEYGWSNNIQEKITQFTFQLNRTDVAGLKSLQDVLSGLIINLKYYIDKGTLPERELAKGYLSILYKTIGHTRDIVDGKGEYTIAYMMIYTWHFFYPTLAKFALKCLVDLGDKKVHQYGSWKDIKYFCEYCKGQGETSEFPLIQYAVELINQQLSCDYVNLIAQSSDISLVAKWVPREKSSFGWLYHALATDYFSQFLTTAKTVQQHEKAVLKCKTEYRKLISALNKQIDTTQIKQCAGNWRDIDFNKVTSITNSKQKKAFLNIKKNGEARFPDKEDRVECAEHFKERIKKAVDGECEMKGKRVGMADFTKQAVELLRNPNKDEIDLLNSQWRDNSSQNAALGNMIAMVDVSGSMEGDPMNVAISLGIRIADKSTLGKRVMTFSSSPSWVNLDGHDDFVSQVEVLRHAPWGMNTNFKAALKMILDAIEQQKLVPEAVQDMVLVILSDMQMDEGDGCDQKALYDEMKQSYSAVGVRVHGKPYKPPHILFWNLRSTSGFPCLSNQPNVSMMSGFSPALLNLFCEQGIDALQSCTPWSLLEQSLQNERYKIMGDKFAEEIDA